MIIVYFLYAVKVEYTLLWQLQSQLCDLLFSVYSADEQSSSQETQMTKSKM